MVTLQDIKSVVTHFSEQIKFTKPSDEVTVAGKIILITKFDDQYFQDEESTQESYIVLVLDDYIGETRIIISNTMYQHYKSIIEVGSFVQIEGLVNLVSTCQSDEYSIVGFNMNTLSM